MCYAWHDAVKAERQGRWEQFVLEKEGMHYASDLWGN